MNPQILNLTFSVEEANLVLTALGHQPYIQVVGVIQKIQAEAQRQLSPQAQPMLESESVTDSDFE